MTLTNLAAVACLLALIPAVLYWVNLRCYLPAPPRDHDVEPSHVSLLIPARNEERSIAAALEAALASEGVDLEVIVLDDASEDRTATIVAEFRERDPRVRLESAPPLPAGWCGKQHACFSLSKLATHGLLAFVDADVRLAKDGLARLAAFLDAGSAELVSGFPRQETGTFLERLLIPMIHFVLLGFLPMARMRRCVAPGYGAGCGQLFLARRKAYEECGGHSKIRASLHDGVTLPRAFRDAGFMTDLCDAGDLATCRMYRSAGEVWKGLAKNATEGLAAPALIGPVTVLLLGGQVLPVVLLLLGLGGDLDAPALGLAAAGTLAAYYPRLKAVRRFDQSTLGALLHPVGVVVLLAIQWYALGRQLLGRPAAWKGRAYDRP